MKEYFKKQNENYTYDIFFDLDHTLWDFDKNSELTFDTIFKRNHPSVREHLLKNTYP
jgi:putative hydrolase of the HAD superfamily